MAIDFDALVRDPIYRLLSVSATYTPPAGGAVTITVIDQTRGEVVHQNAAEGTAVTVPTVHAKAADIADPTEGGTLVINGVTYRIDDSRPIPGPGGVDSGEVMLLLSETT